MRNFVVPGNVVSWQFDAPARVDSVAILVPVGTPDHIKITAYNLDEEPVTAHMTGWEIDPGIWQVSQSTQATENGPLSDTQTHTADFERSKEMTLTLAPRTTTVLELKLSKPGIPYWSRPDLGIDRDDVKIGKGSMTVTVHSLGSVDAPTATLTVRDKSGKTIAQSKTPALKAPTDLLPKTAAVTLKLPSNVNLTGATVIIESTGAPEITQLNNRVQL